MTRSTRLRRLLVPTLASALALTAGAFTTTASAAPSAAPSAVSSGSAHGTALRADHGVVRAHVPGATTVSARRGSSPWPVGFRTGTFTTHGGTATGAPSQQIVSAKVEQARAEKRFLFQVVLGGSPSTTTDSLILVAFGSLQSDGSCLSPDKAHVGFLASQEAKGSTITAYFPSGAAKTGVFDCAFVQSRNASDQTTVYDSVGGRLTDHVQKPIFGIAAKSDLLRPHRFVDFKVTVKNSKKTVAKATRTKLTWKTKDGAVVRGSHRVGTLKPGQKKTLHLRIMIRRAHHGKVKLTATSHGYHFSIDVRVKTVRR